MKGSEIKARVASILDIPLNSVSLIHKKGATPTFEYKDNVFRITYGDINELSHEFLHACFSPRFSANSTVYNAIEDYRISIKAEQYDKTLAQSNLELLPDNLVNLITGINMSEDEEENRKHQMLATVSVHAQAEHEIPKILDALKATVDERHLVDKVRAIVLNSPDIDTAMDACQMMDRWRPRQEAQPRRPDGGLSDRMENAKKVDKKDVEEKLKLASNTAGIPRLNRKDEFLLHKAITKIIQNKEIGKRYNTITGKLNSKRLGRFPSNFLFSQKTRPSPETKMYMLIDMSGSMLRDKMHTTMKFVNTIRDMNIPNFQVELRGFNSLYFSNEEIHRDFNTMIDQCMMPDDPQTGCEACGYNDDGTYLAKIVEEINQDTAANKSLLILSDGMPANSCRHPLDDLDGSVKKLLESNIPYMSIGIESRAVTRYYPKAKVANDTSELVALLGKYTKELVA